VPFFEAAAAILNQQQQKGVYPAGIFFNPPN